MCNGNDEGAKTIEVAAKGVGLFKELEFDHVTVVATSEGGEDTNIVSKCMKSTQV